MANPRPEILVIQGAGMELRGLQQVDVFGPETLAQINAQIESAAHALQLDTDIFHSTNEQTVVDKVAACATTCAALIINPAGFTTSTGALPDAISEFPGPRYEVHASNPAARGIHSTLLPVCTGAICGFGYHGYSMALAAIKQQLE